MMVTPAISKGMVAQIQRASSKRPDQRCVLLLEVTYPGDSAQVSTDWWLQKINGSLRLMGLSADYADPDDPVRYVRNNSSAGDDMQVTALRRKLDEAQLYIEALEAGSEPRTSGMMPEERARLDIEQRGNHVDEHGRIWVDIASAAARIGVSYTTVWRAATGASKNKITAWKVGTTAAGRDRILVQASTWHRHK
jgi:hypothetical protein